MGYEIILPVAIGLSIAHGWLWSKEQRLKAVQEAYDEIRSEIRRERGHIQ